jgi:hypothetical protein
MIDALAVAALATARATVYWLRGKIEEVGRPAHLESDLRRAIDELHVAQTYTTRLHLRLGPHGLAEAHSAAVDALAFISNDAHNRFTGERLGLSRRDLMHADLEAERRIGEFVDGAPRWHEQHLGQD